MSFENYPSVIARSVRCIKFRYWCKLEVFLCHSTRRRGKRCATFDFDSFNSSYRTNMSIESRSRLSLKSSRPWSRVQEIQSNKTVVQFTKKI